MITTVLLHGELGRRFGKRWRFDIKTPAEAVRALEAARPGFEQAILGMSKHDFCVRVGRKSIPGKYLLLPANGKTISITPILQGSASSSKGIIEIIAGVVLIAAGVVMTIYGVPFGTQVALLGISLALGGVAMLLAPSPSTAGESNKKVKHSYIFNGAVNTMEQGGPIPKVYGRPFIGSNVVSADVIAVDIETGSKKSVANADNTGSSNVEGGRSHPAYAGSSVDLF